MSALHDHVHSGLMVESSECAERSCRQRRHGCRIRHLGGPLRSGHGPAARQCSDACGNLDGSNSLGGLGGCVMYAALLILALSLLQISPTVTVATGRTWYSPGDEVTILVSTTGMPENQTLWLYVDGPDGRNWYFDHLSANGTTLALVLPADAQDGTYTVTVTWDHQYVETGFIVESQPIPEFSFAPVVLLLAVTAALATLSRRKAGARTSAPANDSGARRIR